VDGNQPRHDGGEAETEGASDEMFRLAFDFLKVAPANSAGAAAGLLYVSGYDWGFPDRCDEDEPAGDASGDRSFMRALMTHVACALGEQSMDQCLNEVSQ
jgi:hypothetical protein